MSLVPWSRGMIPRLQRGDHEFKSRRNHYFFIIFNTHILISKITICNLVNFSKNSCKAIILSLKQPFYLIILESNKKINKYFNINL